MALQLLGKHPAILFGSRTYLVLKVWSKGIKIMDALEGSDRDGAVQRAPVHSARECPTQEVLWG